MPSEQSFSRQIPLKINVGHFQLDSKNETIRLCPQAAKMHGVSTQEKTLSLSQFLSLVHDSDKEKVASSIISSVNKNTNLNEVYQLGNSSKAKTLINLRGTIINDLPEELILEGFVKTSPICSISIRNLNKNWNLSDCF